MLSLDAYAHNDASQKCLGAGAIGWSGPGVLITRVVNQRKYNTFFAVNHNGSDGYKCRAHFPNSNSAYPGLVQPQTRVPCSVSPRYATCNTLGYATLSNPVFPGAGPKGFPVQKLTPKLLKSETSNLLISYSFEKLKEVIKRRVKVLIKLQELEHPNYINQFVTKIVQVNAPQCGKGSPSRAAFRKYRS